MNTAGRTLQRGAESDGTLVKLKVPRAKLLFVLSSRNIVRIKILHAEFPTKPLSAGTVKPAHPPLFKLIYNLLQIN